MGNGNLQRRTDVRVHIVLRCFWSGRAYPMGDHEGSPLQWFSQQLCIMNYEL